MGQSKSKAAREEGKKMGFCCPDGSLPGLKADYFKEQGKEVTLASGTKIYSVSGGKSDLAILVLPDVFGWSGGRNRAIADEMAAEFKCPVAMPKSFAAFDGGVNDDGLPVDFNPFERWNDFQSWLLSSCTWDKVKPIMVDTVEHLKAGGATKFAILGFCIGGWTMAQTAGLDINVVVGASPHPSIGLEGMVFGGDDVKLTKNIKFPVLLQATMHEGEEYDANGKIFKALPAGSKTTKYPEMSHGFVCRGDLKDEATNKNTEKALAEIVAWFHQHLPEA